MGMVAMLKKTVKTLILGFVCFLLVFIISAGVFFAIRFALSIDVSGAENTLNSNESSLTDKGNKSDGKNKRINFLLLGKDNTSSLCDVIMLVSYNIEESSVGVVQIPRDTYARYTDGSYKKLNGAVNALGSEEAFCDFLSQSFGVGIDYYVSLDLDAVGEIVDIIGGVEVDVPCDMKYADAEQGLYIDIKAGKTLLDGEMAKKFVRYRSSYAQGDIGRIDAQKVFLAALYKKLRNDTSVFEIATVVAKVANKIDTSLSLQDMISLAKMAFSMAADEIRFVTLAGEGAIAQKSGASYYVLSRPSCIEIFREIFSADVTEQNFDKERLFLNEDYAEFERIYFSSARYTVYDAATLCKNGIDIANKK
jgi:LCP family protein required for cell wall assembly